jgi:hypothetical protein
MDCVGFYDKSSGIHYPKGVQRHAFHCMDKKKKASVNVFAEKIKEKFGNGDPNCPMVILYGNWGKRLTVDFIFELDI